MMTTVEPMRAINLADVLIARGIKLPCGHLSFISKHRQGFPPATLKRSANDKVNTFAWVQ